MRRDSQGRTHWKTKTMSGRILIEIFGKIVMIYLTVNTQKK